MELDENFPAIADLRHKARRRLPHFAFEYIDSATGPNEMGTARNHAAFDQVLFRPQILAGKLEPTLKTQLLGQEFTYPFGIAPIGMSGMVWPGAELCLARFARETGIPYCLSTVATRLPEEIGPETGENGWFQLYMPSRADIRQDILARVKKAGFRAVVVTLDVPAEARRERQRRAQLSIPPRITARMIYETLTHPRWALGTLRHGKPRLKLPESYLETSQKSRKSYQHAGHLIRGYPNWDDMKALRQEWNGPLIAKGVMDVNAAKQLLAIGFDAIWVSNHAARQFEAAPPSISVLPEFRKTLGPDATIICDSGIRSGLDIMRALALGANYVFLGKAWHYALAALGKKNGPAHLAYILKEDLLTNMAQTGAINFADLSSRLILPENF